jgi:hypothetical protein
MNLYMRLVVIVMLCFTVHLVYCEDIRQESSDAPINVSLNEKTTILVFPVDVPAINNHQLGKQFANALALALERAGIKNIEVSENVFQPHVESKDNIAMLSKDFSTYIKQNKIDYDYVYFSQFIGDQTTGPQAVLTVFTDSSGKLLWSHRSAPGEMSFEKYKPQDPLACCFVSADAFSKVVSKLSDPLAKDAPKGEWDRYFRTRGESKLPSTTTAFSIFFRITLAGAGIILILISVWRFYKIKKEKK